MRTSKKVVLAAISAVVSYWIAETVLLIIKGFGYPDTFTISWFTFWSVELSALAGIKITEARKNPYVYKSQTDDDIAG